MTNKPEEFIVALYPVDDIWVLWEDIDDTKPAGQQRRKPPNYGAERARFLALCADGKLRAVVFGEWEYTLEDFEDGVNNQGIYTGEGLARFMPKAKISFWDGSKDPRRKPSLAQSGERNVLYQTPLPWQDEVETIIEPARADAFRQKYVWAWTSVSDWIGYWNLNEKRNLSAKDITPALNRLKIEKNEKSVRSGVTGKPLGKGKARLLPFRCGDAKPAVTVEMQDKPETREKPP